MASASLFGLTICCGNVVRILRLGSRRGKKIATGNIRQYRKKPVGIEALIFTGTAQSARRKREVIKWAASYGTCIREHLAERGRCLSIPTLEAGDARRSGVLHNQRGEG